MLPLDLEIIEKCVRIFISKIWVQFRQFSCGHEFLIDDILTILASTTVNIHSRKLLRLTPKAHMRNLGFGLNILQEVRVDILILLKYLTFYIMVIPHREVENATKSFNNTEELADRK